jgi:hypothetical protein
MTIKRYIAEKDTTITNAFKIDNLTRATKSNMGASDILEVFSIYGQVTTSSFEASRVLVQFPIQNILTDRNNKTLSASGSCQFILKLNNSSHSESTPENIYLTISPLSRSWSEGNGLDMEQYRDVGFANWLSASNTEAWTTEGGDIISSYSIDSFIQSVNDDLEVDITSIVEDWLDGTIPNNGLLVSLSSSFEQETESYYTKKFYGRRSQFFFKKPFIEARFNSSVKDKRNNFYVSSSLVDASDNLNTLFLYNSVRGQLKNIPVVGTGTLLVSLYSGTVSSGPIGIPLAINGSSTSVTGGFYSTGVYTASISINSTNEYVYDVWSDLSGNQLYTGSAIELKTHDPSETSQPSEYILSMTNLKNSYNSKELVRLNVEVKEKQWDSNIYHIASYEPETTNIENLFYKIVRISDGYEVIDYGTGSYNHTLCSYDKNGNYFDLDMNIFEPGYSYKIKFGYFFDNNFNELKESFNFRIDK